MSLRLSLAGLLLLLVAGSGPANLAQAPQQPISNSYILSQAICLSSAPAPPVPLKDGCAIQTIPSGSIVEIQLPGDPSVWKASFVSPGIEPLGVPRILDSPGRIEGAGTIYRFRYLLTTGGIKATITFTESPPFVSKPAGKFTYTIDAR